MLRKESDNQLIQLVPKKLPSGYYLDTSISPQHSNTSKKSPPISATMANKDQHQKTIGQDRKQPRKSKVVMVITLLKNESINADQCCRAQLKLGPLLK